MSAVEAAKTRLELAVSRLESIMDQASQTDPRQLDMLREAQAEYEALRHTGDGVLARLDSVIGRLKGVLEV